MIARAALAAMLAAALAACGDDGGTANPDAKVIDAPDPIDAPIDAPPDPTFTAFVIDLVLNQTAGNREPVPYDSFANLPDPDTNNPAAYSSLFN